MLTGSQVAALEAFADTVVPGRKRHDDDRAVVGVSDTPGAVEAGALEVLQSPATGIEDGVAVMADMLDDAARERAEALGVQLSGSEGFVDLDYPRRRRLVAELTAPGSPMRDFWFLLALFSYMAYDSAPHQDTAAAIATGHPGLLALGFAQPDASGRWGFERSSYGVALARLHPDTDVNGNLP